MSRQFRFRIWQHHYQSFVVVPYSFYLNKDFVLSIPDDRFGDCDRKYSYQQYTGVYDQFGVEICEGDFIQNNSGRTFIVEWTYLSFEFREIEKRPDGGTYLDRVVSYIGDLKQCRVVGNVFQDFHKFGIPLK